VGGAAQSRDRVSLTGAQVLTIDSSDYPFSESWQRMLVNCGLAAGLTRDDLPYSLEVA
jgi:hypothetical protein